MLQVWRAAGRYRGGDAEAGIDTRHAFSFSGFYDPDNTGFGTLVACNEERLAPGAGFPEHPHRDVEIVTWVIEGELEHADSTTGRVTRVRPGDVQRLGAAGGVRHVERNAGEGELRFVQMWLVPGAYGGTRMRPGGREHGSGCDSGRDPGYDPGYGPATGREPEYGPEYEVVRGISDGTPFAVPGTEAVLHVRRLPAGARTAVPEAAWVYVHVVRGLCEIGGERLAEGDAARITDARELDATAIASDAVPGGGAELLMWEMHAEPGYG
jgi:quercetin 2,3-dioxygenase